MNLNEILTTIDLLLAGLCLVQGAALLHRQLLKSSERITIAEPGKPRARK